MTIVLNGADYQVEEHTTVAALLQGLDLPSDGVAVAIDREVVPRAEHPTRVVTEGSVVEVIRAVGGG